MQYFAFFEKFEPWQLLLHSHKNPMCNNDSVNVKIYQF